MKLSPTQSVFRHDPLCYDFMIAALSNANYNIYWNNVRYSHWNHVYATLKEQDQSTIKSSLFLQQPLLVAAARVGVVRARPRAGATILVVRVDDADNRTISATNEEERARDDDENGPCNHTLPLPVAVGPVPVVVQPHATHRLEAHEGAQKCAHKRDETTEDGDGRRDDVSSQGDSGGEAKPGDPVPSSGVVEVLCSTQSTDEEVLGDELYEISTLSVKSIGRRNDGTHMSDQDDGCKKTRKRESVANLLHQDTGGS